MRWTVTERQRIEETFHESVGEVEISLFGSRVDDGKKEGDIDL